jgi:hypothetical protein
MCLSGMFFGSILTKGYEEKPFGFSFGGDLKLSCASNNNIKYY